MEEKVYVETQQEKCWLERSEVWKICDVVIYLLFARDGGDFQMRKKLSVSSIAF